MSYSPRPQFWRIRYLAAAAACLLLFWVWSRAGAVRSVEITQGFKDYTEDNAPFTCPVEILPPQVRMTRKLKDGYIMLGHGFPDMISDKFWEGGGHHGWEEPLAQQIDLYMKAIIELDPGRTGFMDLGANIGTHTMLMAARGYNVHTFEPTHANHVLMRCSLTYSGIKDNVRLNTFGLGDRPVSVCMKSASDNFGDSRVDQSVAQSSCPVEQQARVGTIDHYYNTFTKGQRIGVFKIDIQGFEVPALQHATQLFDSDDAPVAVFFEYDPPMTREQGFDPTKLGAFFLDRGYTIWRDSLPTPVTKEQLARFGTEPGWNGGIDLFAVKDSWRKRLDDAGNMFVGGWMQYYPKDSKVAAIA